MNDDLKKLVNEFLGSVKFVKLLSKAISENLNENYKNALEIIELKDNDSDFKKAMEILEDLNL